jgi:hypothetical protein
MANFFLLFNIATSAMVKHEEPFVGIMFALRSRACGACRITTTQATAHACEVSKLSHAETSTIRPTIQQSIIRSGSKQAIDDECRQHRDTTIRLRQDDGKKVLA